ncbi:NAD-dependent epimerase/dehydratase family protein [Streptomyces sp. NPDC102365]|uniref:NAD-dependent epimerase/dehydratase family protein n=1 Tax=Streptomyces sp. NPDC102365 TaxID=3366162 RepID=UPI0037FB2563
MRVGITGGAGFIAGHIIEDLIARGHSVIVFDHLGRVDREIIANADPEGRDYITRMLGTVTDERAVFELAAHVDGIIHLAAVLGTQETIQCPKPSAETNILGSLNVFEAASHYQLPVVYAGVGNHWMRNHGTGSYTISKTAAEDFARMHNAYRDGRITIVRPVNAYGPRQSVAAPYGTSKVRKIMPAFICRALTGAPIEVYGDGTQVSDCVYVTDVARTFTTALEQTAEHGPTKTPVDCGPIKSATVLDVARLVAGIVSVKTGRAPVKIEHLPMRPGEVPNAVVKADTRTLEQIGLSAENFVDLETGISHTVDWFTTHWLPSYQTAA